MRLPWGGESSRLTQGLEMHYFGSVFLQETLSNGDDNE